MSNNKKKCRGCGNVLHLDNFGKNKASKDGHQTRCKSCFKNYKQKPRLIKSLKLDGEIPKPKLNRDQLLKQIAYLKQRESNPITRSAYNYDFLFTNEKFSK